MDLFKLFGTIAIDNDDANEALSETSTNAASADGKLSTMIGTAAKWAAAITGAAIAAGGAVLGFATNVASTTDTIDKMSQKIGISREAYQELDFICSQSGTSVDTLQAGMKSLTAAMDGAASGTASNVEQFEKLGVAVTNADGTLRSQEDVMWDALSALQGVENQTEKARLATELFGRSGTELMPLLNGATGSIDEMRQMAQDLGLVIDNETIDAGVQLSDTMDQVKRSFKAVATRVGAELLPTVQKAFDYIIEKLPEITEKVSKSVDGVKKSINWCKQHKTVLVLIGIAIGTLTTAIIAFTVAQNAATIATALITAATTAFGTVMAFVTSPITLVVLAIGALIAIIVLCVKHWDQIKAKVKEVAEAVKNKVSSMKDAVVQKMTAMKDNAIAKVESLKSAAVAKFNELKEKASEKIAEMKKAVGDKITAIKDGAVNTFNAMKTAITEKVESIKTGITEKFNAVKDGVTNTVEGLKSSVVDKFTLLKTNATDKVNGIKDGAVNAFNNMKSTVSDTVKGIKETISSIFDGIKTAIEDKITAAKNAVSNGISAMKNALNFTWSLPKLKIPHISVTGGEPPYGLGGKGSLPVFKIDWYKKGGILQEPTIFGMNGNQLLGGGEAGAEAVAPIDVLQKYVSDAVASQNAGMVSILEQILEAITKLDSDMGSNMASALNGTSLSINQREFGRLVRGVI